MPLPLVAIVGRPNVGKSTMFNYILKDRLSITDDQPGVTRDRVYGRAEWSGREFYLIDTGGFVPDSEDLIETMVREQVEVAIEEADLILFVVDCQVGPTELDRQIAARLLKQDNRVLLVVNKADNQVLSAAAYEFMKLGLGEPFAVSSTNGLNFGDLLDHVIGILPPGQPPQPSEALRIAILGRPNVGKSSLVNFLAGKKRQIVTDIPGTTRDAVDLAVKHEGQEYILMDTAGLRRKSRIRENLEFFMNVRTLKAINRCDVAVLLIEGNSGLINQDVQIINEIASAYRPLLVCVNKWDLVEKDQHTADNFRARFSEKLATLSYIPLHFISALTGQRATNIFKICETIYAEYTRRIQTSVLNQFLRESVGRRHPPAVKGKYIRLLYMTQVDVAPPSFVIFSNYPELLKADYRRYLENRLRESFGFEGVPLKINYKKRKA